MRQVKVVFILQVLFCFYEQGMAQETVFSGLQGSTRRADKYYHAEAYQKALSLYLDNEKKSHNSRDIVLKIARTYYHLRDYKNAVLYYGRFKELNLNWEDIDLFQYAESLSSAGEYEDAISYYRRYQKLHNEDKSIIEKIWRLTYIQNLLEDSIHFEVRLANIGPGMAKHSPVLYNKGIVFVAEKEQIGGVVNTDYQDNSNYKTLYFAQILNDTLYQDSISTYAEPVLFGKGISSRFNTGPVSFFPEGNRMIFTRNGKYDKEKGSTLQLFIAEKREGKWIEVSSMPFNSGNYSVSDPALTSEGDTLYFASDMPGGYGKKDIYVSRFLNEKWSKPINLGDKINSSGDELRPFAHKDNLYFASDGHGGLGGLDIFKIKTTDFESEDLINMGYPINSSMDDFGIALNNAGTFGFISSNRRLGGYHDDIYEIEIDLQTYPITINGNVKYKELEWRGTDRDEILANADLFLIDTRRKIQVSTGRTDSRGNFQLEIPYAGSFSIIISSPSIGERTVKLEIPKNKKPDASHNIMLVKNSQKLINDDL